MNLNINISYWFEVIFILTYFQNKCSILTIDIKFQFKLVVGVHFNSISGENIKIKTVASD